MVNILINEFKKIEVIQGNQTVEKNVGLTDEEITDLYHDLQQATGKSIRYYGVEGYDRQIFNIFSFLADKSLLILGTPKDKFVEILYKGYKVDSRGNKIEGTDFTKSAEEIMNMSDEEKRYIRINDQNIRRLDPFFETMFYKVYVGAPPQTTGGYMGGGGVEEGEKSIPRYHIPCYNMLHFYAEFVSDISKYPSIDSYGMSAVVIAKYYECARVNGTVTFLGEPVNATLVVLKNITALGQTIPVPHDRTNTGKDGEYSLLVPAGNITIQVRRYPELGERAFVMKNVSFNKVNDEKLSPITDKEAMRLVNFTRFVDIDIEPANIKGYIYQNMDNDTGFNASIDQPLPDLVVSLREMEKIDTQNPEQNKFKRPLYLLTNNDGFYNKTSLKPGFYELYVSNNKYLFYATSLSLKSGVKFYNVSKPENVTIKGVVFYDKNGNGKYDEKEEVADARVRLLHKMESGEEEVYNLTTNETGRYVFKSVFPGKINNLNLNEYVINVSKLPEYQSEVTVYPEEGKTTFLNVSVQLANVTVNGTVRYNNKTVSDIIVKFTPAPVEDNTALRPSVQPVSDENGRYSVKLRPGWYNISVEKYEGNTLVYSHQSDINVEKNVSVRPNVDIVLTKHSVTVNGTTSYKGVAQPNITINFRPDLSVSEITQAKPRTVMSNEQGFYTAELSPGYYNISVESEVFQKDGKNYSYEWTGKLQVKEEEIETGIKLDISLNMVERKR